MLRRGAWAVAAGVLLLWAVRLRRLCQERQLLVPRAVARGHRRRGRLRPPTSPRTARRTDLAIMASNPAGPAADNFAGLLRPEGVPEALPQHEQGHVLGMRACAPVQHYDPQLRRRRRLADHLLWKCRSRGRRRPASPGTTSVAHKPHTQTIQKTLLKERSTGSTEICMTLP